MSFGLKRGVVQGAGKFEARQGVRHGTGRFSKIEGQIGSVAVQQHEMRDRNVVRRLDGSLKNAQFLPECSQRKLCRIGVCDETPRERRASALQGLSTQ
ncbi:hypothetical protein GCM10008957_24430 [Deinococcus ruber]|uniref:Uncharacterized protein n=1 Tax=Deinococcus ruber TaxID=1848197 RepID=A0A918C8Q4_9DEIO|nr:hypothetical protein GCM10008957_24430 [Deinococcus ruber]